MKKRTIKVVDPYAKRESQKYDNPIPSREYILKTLDNATGPLTRRQLSDMLGIVSDHQKEALRRRLFAMERDGQIHSNRKRAYACVNKLDLIHGRIQAHRDGFGFLIPTDNSGDIYLPYRQMRKVFDGDEVLGRLTQDSFRGKREGKIVDIISRNTQQIVGRYFYKKGVSFVRPDNPRLSHDILISPEATMGAGDNQFVIVEITQYPDSKLPAMGTICEVLGDHMAPGMEIDVAIRSHNLPHLWPVDVQVEAANLSSEVDEKDKVNRVDLRHLHFVTIDGEDARDFDDAVYCELKKSGGWRLYVAVADVSHYVSLGSALDREAEMRSTSVYFPDFVLPMLPEALSNGLCSLNPHVDRLAMICEITISTAGRISGYQFYEGVIYSHARLTYTKVGKMLMPNDSEGVMLRQEYHHVIGNIDHLYEVYSALKKVRKARGAIDFETTETRILFDEQRKIERIVPVVRNNAHKLIEECMLCANVCAAKFLEKHELDGLYRVHEGPKERKLENLQAFLGELGLELSTKAKPVSADYQQLVDTIAGRPDAKVIQTVMLRSLSQAVYQPDNNGHFGLAYSAYTHFTSPIRRYPDLLTHRAIRHIIRSRKSSTQVKRVKGAGVIAKKAIYPYKFQDILRLGEQASMAERRADDATRDVVGWLKCEFLQDRIGDSFSGVITAVTSFGIFVELLDVYVEGLVHVASLPSDYYHYEEAHHRLIGERTRRVFSLGDELLVQVAAVNLDDRKVDFELLENHNSKIKAKKLLNNERSEKDLIRKKPRRGDLSGQDDRSLKKSKGHGKEQLKKIGKGTTKKAKAKKIAKKKVTGKKIASKTVSKKNTDTSKLTSP
ncbi:ribonuclease R [Candidatus Endobugula sertula]|uniref:Ribonuclease R n=1 Tax=Candidatus Endobugula sertula TaxID=62101 RepID=A0A1D2QMN3_9GAMM|nr:ribonuclease R [Candidatus Endobugula sertula]